jgi:hypothetical protein
MLQDFRNSPPRIWSFDIATTTGFAEGYAGDRPLLQAIKFSREMDGDYDVEARALKWIAEKLALGRPDFAFIEAPFAGNSQSSRGKGHQTTYAVTRRLLGLAAIIGAALRAKRVPVRDVSIQAVRKRFLGDGRLSGDVAKKRAFALCKELGWDPPNHDAADAAAVFHFGVLQVAPSLAVAVEPLLFKLSKGSATDEAEGIFTTR